MPDKVSIYGFGYRPRCTAGTGLLTFVAATHIFNFRNAAESLRVSGKDQFRGALHAGASEDGTFEQTTRLGWDYKAFSRTSCS